MEGGTTNRKEKEAIFPFEDIYIKYPNKVGKKAAQAHFKATVITEQDWLDIQAALTNYVASERVRKGFIQNASTWFNNWRDWIDNPEPAKNSNIPESLRPYMKKE